MGTERFVVEGTAKRRDATLTVTARNQFDFEGVWLRGNFHCHVGGPEHAGAVRDWYRDRGFDFLAATDHDAVTAFPPEQDGFITLPGSEISHAHVVGLGLRDAPAAQPRTVEGIADIVEAVRAQGGAAILAHPHWSGWRWEELRAAAEAGIEGFEVVNAICYGINGKGRSDQLWTLLLDRGYRPSAIGSDDAHSTEDRFAGKGWTGVLAAQRTPEAVLDAVREGRTYASEGPQLRAIRWQAPGTVVVECSPCAACHFMSNSGGARTRLASEPSGQSDHFELDLATEGYRIGAYLSVVIEDDRGRRAWSSAMDVETSMVDR